MATGCPTEMHMQDIFTWMCKLYSCYNNFLPYYAAVLYKTDPFYKTEPTLTVEILISVDIHLALEFLYNLLEPLNVTKKSCIAHMSS